MCKIYDHSIVYRVNVNQNIYEFMKIFLNICVCFLINAGLLVCFILFSFVLWKHSVINCFCMMHCVCTACVIIYLHNLIFNHTWMTHSFHPINLVHHIIFVSIIQLGASTIIIFITHSLRFIQKCVLIIESHTNHENKQNNTFGRSDHFEYLLASIS